ncbi:MAG: hypothetical protein JWN94_684 [Betaproteobacteria bacterium]|nr:hypothetical protein [Betaproteobacteria bacterium]
MTKINHRDRWLLQFAVLLSAVAALPAGAQQLSILSGVTKERVSHDDSFAYVADYSEPLTKLFSYSLVYVNEGHLFDHHRDGMGAQLWAGFNITPRWSVKAGTGPYLYFDTAARPGVVFADNHGIGLISSVATNYQFTKHWAVELRANRILTNKSIDTTSIVAGVGYTFDAAVLPGSAEGAAAWQSDRLKPNEVTVYVGHTYVNNFESETSTAYELEYRRNLSRHIDWTVAALREGAPGPINRSGALTEIWATRALLNDRVSIGVGVGPYLAYDSKDNDRTRLTGVLSLTASMKIPGNLIARATWHRVTTRNDRDTDVFLIGAGYRW